MNLCEKYYKLLNNNKIYVVWKVWGKMPHRSTKFNLKIDEIKHADVYGVVTKKEELIIKWSDGALHDCGHYQEMLEKYPEYFI